MPWRALSPNLTSAHGTGLQDCLTEHSASLFNPVPAVPIQRVSWRRPRAVDYRAVEGAVTADGIGKLLSDFAGIVPTQNIGVSVPAVELTGVAVRRVGIIAAGVLTVPAFPPRFPAMILAIPSAVVVAYLTVVLALTFVLGMTEAVQGGTDHRKGLIAGVA